MLIYFLQIILKFVVFKKEKVVEISAIELLKNFRMNLNQVFHTLYIYCY